MCNVRDDPFGRGERRKGKGSFLKIWQWQEGRILGEEDREGEAIFL